MKMFRVLSDLSEYKSINSAFCFGNYAPQWVESKVVESSS